MSESLFRSPASPCHGRLLLGLFCCCWQAVKPTPFGRDEIGDCAFSPASVFGLGVCGVRRTHMVNVPHTPVRVDSQSVTSVLGHAMNKQVMGNDCIASSHMHVHRWTSIWMVQDAVGIPAAAKKKKMNSQCTMVQRHTPSFLVPETQVLVLRHSGVKQLLFK